MPEPSLLRPSTIAPALEEKKIEVPQIHARVRSRLRRGSLSQRRGSQLALLYARLAPRTLASQRGSQQALHPARLAPRTLAREHGSIGPVRQLGVAHHRRYPACASPPYPAEPALRPLCTWLYIGHADGCSLADRPTRPL
jgi:hypothetical protein